MDRQGQPTLHQRCAVDRQNRSPLAGPPERFGLWNSVWKRFDRWSRKGVWQQVFEALASQDPDLEWLILDSTAIRAHQHAAGKKATVFRVKG